jgi:hypothetical protein
MPATTPTVLPLADVHVEPGLNNRSEEEVEAGLGPLRDSIARHGILQPLVVRPREQGGYWLVAGHRRPPELRDETPPAKPGVQAKASYPDAREAEKRFWQ